MAREKTPKIKKIKEKRMTTHNLVFIIMGLLLSAGLFVGMIYLQNYLSEEIVYKSVLVAKEDIPENVVITKENAQQYLTLKQMNVLDTTSASMNTADDLLGKKAIVPLMKGEIVTQKDFEDIVSYIDEIENPVELSIGLNGAATADGGKLRAGDLINITMSYAISNDDSTGENYIETITPNGTGSIRKEDNTNNNYLFGQKLTDMFQYVLEGIYIKDALDGNGVSIATTDTQSITSMIIIVVDRSYEKRLNNLISFGANMRVSKILNKEKYLETLKEEKLQQIEAEAEKLAEAQREAEEKKRLEEEMESFVTETETDILDENGELVGEDIPIEDVPIEPEE